MDLRVPILLCLSFHSLISFAQEADDKIANSLLEEFGLLTAVQFDPGKVNVMSPGGTRSPLRRDHQRPLGCAMQSTEESGGGDKHHEATTPFGASRRIPTKPTLRSPALAHEPGVLSGDGGNNCPPARTRQRVSRRRRGQGPFRGL